ncbi:MAG: (2Fe-2S)-binding protein [Pseudomonadota bacterium]
MLMSTQNADTVNEDPANEIMCSCSGTTRGKIYDLYKQGLDIESISQRTGAKTGCGGCEWDIEEFVKALQQLG